ncbi:MnhB domain-containing protein [Halorubrum cibi]|uniref:Multicomponent Na+:H+ antiporter subunit B n=1 Tax=Halorubrum cibi TaxID=413815 RepID=A0A521E522_9EURY|nr:MnhB domain-containing protein [Halorubrum cibi]SMO79039.1 multicomponent Na+:H+ antiporter subunit B [Halorubrum cibi]
MSDADASDRDADAGRGGDAETADVDSSASAGRLDSETRQGPPYTESQVIMSTVKVVAPFAFTYGLFVTFHGGGSPGGGFQGGAITAAVVFMIAFAFGIESTRQWLANTVVVALAVGGTLVFAGLGLVPVARGGAFLQYDLLPLPYLDPVKYGMEAVEIVGIAPIVSGVLVGLFFVLARGFNGEGSGPPIGERGYLGSTSEDAEPAADGTDETDETDDPNSGSAGQPATDGGAR